MSEPNVVQRLPEQLEKDIRALDWRDLQLWGIGACVLLALAGGLVLLLAPQLIWKANDSAHSTNLPLYTLGLIALLLLLNAHTLYQRLRLHKIRAQLMHQLQLAERAAQVDPLTGVFNRRYMEVALAREIRRAERHHTSLCLAVIDVDRFKDFNTRFGHPEGDSVLTVVASLLSKNFRAADIVVRYGGDEFIVVMTETDLLQATTAIHRLKKHYFAHWNRVNRSAGYAISITCGVAELKKGMTAGELIREADRVMLEAKSRATEEESGSQSPLRGISPIADDSADNLLLKPSTSVGAPLKVFRKAEQHQAYPAS